MDSSGHTPSSICDAAESDHSSLLNASRSLQTVSPAAGIGDNSNEALKNSELPVDYCSQKKMFGWSITKGVGLPHVYRSGMKYVSVSMVEYRILYNYPSTCPEELNESPLFSVYATAAEVSLLNELNAKYCKRELGNFVLTTDERLVKLDDLQEFLMILDKYVPNSPSITHPRAGWLQINNTVIPYVLRGCHLYVPLQIVQHSAGLLTHCPVMSYTPTTDESVCLNTLCKQAGLNFFVDSTVSLMNLRSFLEHDVQCYVCELPKDNPFAHAKHSPKYEDANGQKGNLKQRQGQDFISLTSSGGLARIEMQSKAPCTVHRNTEANNNTKEACSSNQPKLHIAMKNFAKVKRLRKSVGEQRDHLNKGDQECSEPTVSSTSSFITSKQENFLNLWEKLNSAQEKIVKTPVSPETNLQNCPMDLSNTSRPITDTQTPLSPKSAKQTPIISAQFIRDKSILTLDSQYVLIEALVNVFWPSVLTSFLIFSIECISKVELRDCTPEEEEAFIRSYKLPIKHLRCKKLIRLDDFERLYPDLQFMLQPADSDDLKDSIVGDEHQEEEEEEEESDLALSAVLTDKDSGFIDLTID